MDNQITFITGKNAGLIQLYLPHVLEPKHGLVEFPENGRHPQDLWDYVIPKLIEREDPVVVITLSSLLLNILGEAIRQGHVDKDRLKIHVVEERAEVSTVEFDEDGFFGDGWPFGFLSPDTRNKPVHLS